MANIYKNAFFDPADTANTVIYATDTLTRAIIQNIQITNTEEVPLFELMFLTVVILTLLLR